MPSNIKSKEIDIVLRLPLQGNFDLTYRCNNNCLHCWIRVFSKRPERRNELNTDEIKAIVDDASKMGCKSWSISGGEPMIRPDFQEIFDYITKKSSSYSINTNGTLITPEIAELMKRKGRKIITLYGATADVHDLITRNPGSFQATMKGFQLLQEAGAEFIVQIVPMKDNYHQIEEMKELAKSLSPYFRTNVPWFFLSAEEDLKRNEEIKLQRLGPSDVIKLGKPQVSDREGKLENYDCFSESDNLLSSCKKYKREFHIDPYGSMSFCNFIRGPSLRYDLRNGSFKDCWEIFIPSLKDLVRGNQEYRHNCGSHNFRNQCSRKLKNDCEKNYYRYFKCGGITIKIETNLPITEKTFHPTFYLFQVDRPEENMITFQRYFKMPNLDSRDLGEIMYQKNGWEVRRKENSWIYVNYFNNNTRVKTIAFFNKDYTKARMYTNEIETNDQKMMGYKESTVVDAYLDDIFLTQTSLAHVLANLGGIYLHSSGIVIDGKGILFVGHSGAGKSTIRNMALLKEDIKPLCNDHNIVRKCQDGYRVSGIWANVDDLSEIQATSVPLGAIMFLEHAKENTIFQLEDMLEVTKRILPCVIRPIESIEWWDKTLETIDDFIREVPCYRLRFDLTGKIIEKLQDISYWC